MPQRWRCISNKSCRVQAQARMQESSQKVDLLRLSLEKHLIELPQDHPTRAVIKEILMSGASLSYGTPKKHSALSSTSSSFFKPASLTGHLFKPIKSNFFIFFIIMFFFNPFAYFSSKQMNCNPNTRIVFPVV